MPAAEKPFKFSVGLAIALSLVFLFLHFIFFVSIPGLSAGTVSEIHWDRNTTIPAPFTASRWADLLIGPIYAFLIVLVLKPPQYLSEHHTPTGFTTGLIVGTVASAIITLIMRIFALPHWAFVVSLFGGGLVALISILITLAAYDPERGVFFIPNIILSTAAGTAFGGGFIFGIADGLVLALPFVAAGIVLGLFSWSFFLFVRHKIPPDRYPTGPLYKSGPEAYIKDRK